MTTDSTQTSKTQEVEVFVTLDNVALVATKSIEISNSFIPFEEQFKEWEKKIDGLEITDVKQTKEMKMAKDARLAIGKVRKAIGDTKDKLKEETKAYNSHVMSVHNPLVERCKELEAKLKDKEEFKKRAEEAALAVIRKDREDSLTPEELALIPSHKDIEKYSEDEWGMAVEGAKAQIENKILREKQAEIQAKIDADNEAKVDAPTQDAPKEDGPSNNAQYYPNDGSLGHTHAEVPKTVSLEDAEVGRIYRILGTSTIVLKSSYKDPAGNIECYVIGTGDIYTSASNMSDVGVHEVFIKA
jgi:hypothetical protein